MLQEIITKVEENNTKGKARPHKGWKYKKQMNISLLHHINIQHFLVELLKNKPLVVIQINLQYLYFSHYLDTFEVIVLVI